MLCDKTKLLLILSVILVSLLSNKLSAPFFEGNVIHDTALALRSTFHDPFQNNTGIQSTISPNYQKNSTSSNVSALVHKGSALYSLGNYTQAIQYYDKALAVDPNNKRALNNKGSTLYSLGNYRQAIQSFDKALAIDPNYAAALTGKGAALDSLGNHTQAIQLFDKALAVDPNYKVALNNKGSTLYGLGNHTQAIQYYYFTTLEFVC